VSQFLAGKLSGGVHEGGIAEGIFVPVYTDGINQKIRDEVSKAMQNVKDGKVNLQALF